MANSPAREIDRLLRENTKLLNAVVNLREALIDCADKLRAQDDMIGRGHSPELTRADEVIAKYGKR